MAIAAMVRRIRKATNGTLRRPFADQHRNAAAHNRDHAPGPPRRGQLAGRALVWALDLTRVRPDPAVICLTRQELRPDRSYLLQSPQAGSPALSWVTMKPL